jgi:hypothetical protein
MRSGGATVKRLLLSVATACLLSVAITAQEPIAFELELYRNATLVASPIVKVRDGETGTMRLRDLFNLAFTPTQLEDDRIAVRFEIQNGTRTLTPQMVLDHAKTATLNWITHTDDGDREQLEVRITAVGS